MPVLSDDMYCSEQICIPPSFPYLLRQYAKAAIRTQPTDLLKWSTAYFRCLSLNIPPPVKPRLEYPIPRDHHGITPGWLKALLYQLQNNLTIPFKVLWDRWVGACLEHNTLIQLLCLGGFQDPQAIPWLRFVALCAGTLTDDLTHTMILICEILTEEPEGGSAMIPLETFVDLYKFLAKIDASEDQMIKNLWFRDSLLSLWRERVEKVEVEEEVHEELIVESEASVASKTSSESVEKEDQSGEMDKVVSCPSLPEDDQYSLEYLLKEVPGEEDIEEEGVEEVEDEEKAVQDIEEQSEDNMDRVSKVEEEEGKEEAEEDNATKESEIKEDHQKEEDQEEGETKSDNTEAKPKGGDEEQEEEEETQEKEVEEADAEQTAKTDEEKAPEGEEKPAEEEKGDLEVKEYESAETIQDQPVRDLNLVFEDDATLKEDLERLRALQQELAGETDEELEKFKCRLIEEMPLTESHEEGIKHFKMDKLDHPSSEEKLKVISGEKLHVGEVSSESQVAEEEQGPYDEVFVEAIPGIGGIVPDHLIEAVVEYMKNCAKIQHGMVMPRNIRHYSCPPLEILEY